jgi:small-conductance mechanosensitive channel
LNSNKSESETRVSDSGADRYRPISFNGVAGVVLGLAAKESLSMIIAGFQIALTNPMKIEAVVIVESEYSEIEKISLTYVVLRA